MSLTPAFKAVKRQAVSILATTALAASFLAPAAAQSNAGATAPAAPVTNPAPPADAAPPAPMSSSAPETMATPAPTENTSKDMAVQQNTEVKHACSGLAHLTSRPLVSTSACVVPQGHALIEAGYLNEKNQDTGDITSVYPLATLRIGTNIRNLEISVTAPSESRTKTVGGAHPHNLGDAGVGAKYQLGESSKFVHSISVGLTLPTGDQNGTTNANTYNASYNAEYAFTKVFSARVSENFVSNAYRGQSTLADPTPPTLRYGSFTSSLGLMATIPKVVNVFAEESAYSRNYGAGSSETQFIGGLSKSISERAQIDAEYSAQNEKNASGPSAKAHGFGAGLSFYL